ncbi:hypothetical protein P4V39_03870 [Brevibacillus borstelensis]|uniref:hypothetical protein n=1 Tax=Brevibacillus borstelensis TaxID=45462 RepID=UPI002E1B5A9C|nr:hypothetical protein [Brevibacillus borstelensis]
MTKKDYVASIIKNIQKHNDIIPSHLQEVSRNVETVSSQSFFMQTNHVVTEPASQRTYNPNEPLFRLSEGYRELKTLAETNRASRPDLKSAVDQLEGLLGTSESYSPE